MMNYKAFAGHGLGSIPKCAKIKNARFTIHFTYFPFVRKDTIFE